MGARALRQGCRQELADAEARAPGVLGPPFALSVCFYSFLQSCPLANAPGSESCRKGRPAGPTGQGDRAGRGPGDRDTGEKGTRDQGWGHPPPLSLGSQDQLWTHGSQDGKTPALSPGDSEPTERGVRRLCPRHWHHLNLRWGKEGAEHG